jgi:hypothetical protein
MGFEPGSVGDSLRCQQDRMFGGQPGQGSPQVGGLFRGGASGGWGKGKLDLVPGRGGEPGGVFRAAAD